MKCSKYDLDSFVAKHIKAMIDGGEEAKPMSIDEADSFLGILVDLVWPDMPIGFTVEEFTESWNRHAGKAKSIA